VLGQANAPCFAICSFERLSCDDRGVYHWILDAFVHTRTVGRHGRVARVARVGGGEPAHTRNNGHNNEKPSTNEPSSTATFLRIGHCVLISGGSG
jgi:hypothetical protein